MPNPLPTIILVHGAWHRPAHYKSYITDLQAAGFTVHCPQLPTCTGTISPNITTAEDISVVRSVLDACIGRGERILLIMHSYGGLVGTEAAQGLDLVTLQAENANSGGVIHLLYLCGYILSPGQTIWDLVTATGVDKLWPQLVDTAPDGSVLPLDSDMGFFSGIEEQSVVDEAVGMLVRFPMEPLTFAACGDVWKRVPATYVRTIRDNAVPPAYQDIMLEKVREEGVVLEISEYDTHHSIWISLPLEMVAVALKAAGDGRNLG
jgi:pimeloyl-ACP methyl ester carboxylesterase